MYMTTDQRRFQTTLIINIRAVLQTVRQLRDATATFCDSAILNASETRTSVDCSALIQSLRRLLQATLEEIVS